MLEGFEGLVAGTSRDADGFVVPMPTWADAKKGRSNASVNNSFTSVNVFIELSISG